ncbi:hypothetical protein AB4Z50_15020 [Paenibacillus sp. 2TAB26]|uniref:hypothetical protein n=1 Tax=Paenibacillus sp. 2TAB26 TaxID=3233005 RepID=UPI003F9BF7A0
MKFSIVCQCTGVGCNLCEGTGFIPSTDLHFADLKEGVSYKVIGPYSDEFSFAEAYIKRGTDTLSFTFTSQDEANGGQSQNAELRIVVFKIELLGLLRNIGIKYGIPENESEFLIKHLVDYQDLDVYQVSDLVEVIGVGIEEAEMTGNLREWDSKYGTTLRCMVSILPKSEWSVDLDYAELCGYIVDRMNRDNVTLLWALREFEKDRSNARGVSVLDILVRSVKTLGQLERDIMLKMKPVQPFILSKKHKEVAEKALQSYIEFSPLTPKSINRGCCEDFAEYLNSSYTSEGLSSHETFCTFDFISSNVSLSDYTGDCECIKDWREDSMSSLGVPFKYFQEYRKKVEKFEPKSLVCYHVWLYDGKYHYDSECLDGVINPLELPFFQRLTMGQN